MTIQKAIQIVEALICGNADCRCGNFTIDDETVKAIKLLIEIVETK